jgi:hypothetical protein
MASFPLLDLPSCVTGHLLSFVQDQDLVRCHSINNRKLIGMLAQVRHFQNDKRHIKIVNPFGKGADRQKVISIWPYVHHFVNLTHFEFVNARFSNWGEWNGHFKTSFCTIDLIHLPKTLKVIKIYNERINPHRIGSGHRKLLIDEDEKQIGTLPLLNTNIDPPDENWDYLDNDESEEYDYMTVDSEDQPNCSILDRLFCENRYPYLTTLDIRIFVASVTPRCISNGQSLQNVTTLTLRKTPFKSFLHPIAYPSNLTRLNLIAKLLANDLAVAAKSFPRTLTCFEFIPNKSLDPVALLQALPQTLKSLKIQTDHFQIQNKAFQNGTWFQYLPITLEKLVVQ